MPAAWRQHGRSWMARTSFMRTSSAGPAGLLRMPGKKSHGPFPGERTAKRRFREGKASAFPSPENRLQDHWPWRGGRGNAPSASLRADQGKTNKGFGSQRPKRKPEGGEGGEGGEGSAGACRQGAEGETRGKGARPGERPSLGKGAWGLGGGKAAGRGRKGTGGPWRAPRRKTGSGSGGHSPGLSSSSSASVSPTWSSLAPCLEQATPALGPVRSPEET